MLPVRPPAVCAAQLSSSERWQLPTRRKERYGSRASRMGLISLRDWCLVRTSLSCSSRGRAVMLRTVLWMACASPEMELGLTRENKALRGIAGSISDSQIWFPSQVNATTKEGSKKGSKRSRLISAYNGQSRWWQPFNSHSNPPFNVSKSSFPDSHAPKLWSKSVATSI